MNNINTRMITYGVAGFVLERDAEQVELVHRVARLQRAQGLAVLAQQLLHVGPG